MAATDSCTVRRASSADPADLVALRELRRRWRIDERGEVPVDGFDELFDEWVTSHASSHHGYLGFVAGAPVAMGWLAVVERVPGPATPHRTCGYVQSVYVDQSVRNQGHGATLMTALIDDARALGLDYLAVHPSEFAFSFYKRLGFAPTATVLELDFRTRVDPEVGRPS